MSLLPSAKELLTLAIRKAPDADVNTLHGETYNLILHYRKEYYEGEVDAFLGTLDIGKEEKAKMKKGLLEPTPNGYSNIMEKISRRVSQSIQPLSGNIAQLCVERELIKAGLEEDVHFIKGQKKRTDIIIYHKRKTHRVEIKNVSMRERAVRGLGFDGDSLFGFFNAPAEFTDETIKIIDGLCKKSGGYCYIPPATLKRITIKSKFIRPNTQFGKDIKRFVRGGKL